MNGLDLIVKYHVAMEWLQMKALCVWGEEHAIHQMNASATQIGRVPCVNFQNVLESLQMTHLFAMEMDFAMQQTIAYVRHQIGSVLLVRVLFALGLKQTLLLYVPAMGHALLQTNANARQDSMEQFAMKLWS